MHCKAPYLLSIPQYVIKLQVHIFHKTLLDWMRTLDPNHVADGGCSPFPTPRAFVLFDSGPSSNDDPHSSAKAPQSPSRAHHSPAKAVGGVISKKPSHGTASGLSPPSQPIAKLSASQSIRREKATESVAMRLSSLMNKRPPRKAMTAAVADEFDLRLDIAQGHATISRMLLQDLKRCAGTGRMACSMGIERCQIFSYMVSPPSF